MALNEKYLRELAADLGHEWEALASYLDFRKSEIDQIKLNSVGNVNNQIFTMLVHWSRRQGSSGNAAVSTLIESLRKIERNDLADKIKERASHPATHSGVHDRPTNFNPLHQQQPQAAAGATTTSFTYDDPHSGSVRINRLNVTGTNSPIFLGPVSGSTFHFGGSGGSGDNANTECNNIHQNCCI